MARGKDGPVDPRNPKRRRTVRLARMSIQDEVQYIVRRARLRDSRVVRVGPIVLFSTTTVDEWMLDPEDGTALPLARDGDPLPVRVLESEHQFAIEWTHEYRIDGELFCALERATGRATAVAGYPVGVIATA